MGVSLWAATVLTNSCLCSSKQGWEACELEQKTIFPVLLKVGFFIVGTLGAGRRGRAGGPRVASGLEDPWFLRGMAPGADSGTPPLASRRHRIAASAS